MEKPWDEKDVEKIEKNVALGYVGISRHAAHAMFYSKSDKSLFERIPMRYNVLMVMRFDGNLGFPGGFVEVSRRNETIEEGLSRELMEEINLDEKFTITETDYHGSYTQLLGTQKVVNHFYLKEVSESDFAQIEKGCFNALEWGKETLGIVNVPVQTGVGIGRTYLPIVDFLQNKFIGNARQELVEGILHAGIFTEEEMCRLWMQMPRN